VIFPHLRRASNFAPNRLCREMSRRCLSLFATKTASSCIALMELCCGKVVQLVGVCRLALTSRIVRRHSHFDHAFHTHQIGIHLALWICAKERRNRMSQAPSHWVVRHPKCRRELVPSGFGSIGVTTGCRPCTSRKMSYLPEHRATTGH
jgi:hypothetical protein